MARSGSVGVLVICALVVAGCGAGQGAAKTPSTTAPRPTGTTLGLTSTAFVNDSTIPARYTCDGEGVSPPLTWTRVPGRARSLALVVVDPDATGGAFVHWSVWDLSRGSTGLGTGHVPQGAKQGSNSAGSDGYTGPCPPPGDEAHHYVFSVYALDADLGLEAGASPRAVQDAVAQHAIATGTLTGRYRR